MSEDWYYNQYNSDDSLLLESPNLEEAIGTINNTNISINENVTKQYSEEQEKPSSEETFANSFRQKVGQINYNDSFNQSSNLDPNNNDGVASFSLTNNTYNYYKKLVEISRCLGKTTLSKPELDTRSNMVDLLGFLAEQKSRTTNDLNFDNYFANPQKGSTNLKRRTSYLFKEICLDKRSFSIAVLLDETNRAWADILWTLREEYLSDTKKNFNDYVEWNIESIDKISLITFTVNGLIIEKLNSPQIRCRAAFIKKNPKSLKSVEKLCFQLSAPAIQPSFDSTQQILPNTNYSSFAISSYTSENPMNEELYEKGIDNVIPTGCFIQNEPEEENMHYNHYTTQSDSNSEIDIEMQLYTSMINPSSSLSDTIQQDKTSTQQYNVPKLPQIHDLLPRKNDTDKLRELLLTSSNENSNIVVLNGPRGCGLTTLASMVCHGYHSKEGEIYLDNTLDGRFCDGIYYFSFRTDEVNVIQSAEFIGSIREKMKKNEIKDIYSIISAVRKEKALLILDDVDSVDCVYKISDILSMERNQPHLTLLVITSAFRSFKDTTTCTVNYLDKDEAKMHFFRRAKIDQQQLACTPLLRMDSYAEKILAYCAGHILAISLVADYISKKENRPKDSLDCLTPKMSRLVSVFGSLWKGDMDKFESYHNGRMTKLNDYLNNCCPEKILSKIKQLALFPGGCCIPSTALNWIWSTMNNGDTDHYIDDLFDKFLLFKENDELYSLPYLFYLFLRKLCDQDWLLEMECKKYVALRDDSYGSYPWLKKIVEKLGIDVFKRQHLKFLEDNTDRGEIQTYVAHTYIRIFSESMTVDAVKKNLDKVVQYVEHRLNKLLEEIQTILQSFATPCDVLLCLSSLQRIVDFILKEHDADNYQGESRFTARYLQEIKRNVSRFSGAYEFFKRLHQEWSHDDAAELLKRSDNELSLENRFSKVERYPNQNPSGNYTSEPQSSVEEVTSQITLIDTSGELIRQNNNNLFEDRFVISNEELTTKYTLSDHFLAPYEDGNAEKYIDIEDMNHD